MKTSISRLIVALLLLTPLFAVSQVKDKQKEPADAFTETKTGSGGESFDTGSSSSLTTRETMIEGAEGNIYLGTSWPEGIIELPDGSNIKGRNFRYDIYADQMQMTDGKDTMAIARPEEISSLSFDGHTFIYKPYECSGLVKEGYFEVIVPGKTELLLKRSVTFHLKGDESGGKDKYYVSDCYFLKKGSNPAFKVMCNKKSALEALCEHKDEINAYIRKTGKKVKTPDDLKELVNYYNSLE
jgi:hypothetical protein